MAKPATASAVNGLRISEQLGGRLNSKDNKTPPHIQARYLGQSVSRDVDSELILATAPHVDPESPAFKADDLKKVEKIEMADAASAVLGSGFAFREEASSDDFDWHADDSIILKEQPATAVYFNKGGNLVIRQKGDWNDDGDKFLFITPENFNLFADGVAARIRDGG